MVDNDRPKKGQTEAHGGVKPRAAEAPMVPRLVAVSGPGAGRSFVMTSGFATAGRHTTNDLVLADARVSAMHLELRRRGDRVLVRDAGSTNGTWLGPHRVSELELAAGGEITVGDTNVRVEVDRGDDPGALSPDESFGDLVGQSAPMRELFGTLARVAPKNIGLLLQGETGTGKEEVARAVHARSPRAGKPFVVIDATALPETLAEAILFGHEKGAFTGANERRAGLFENANGGTVLLDEVGELAPALQAKFLRVLERQEFTRVGGSAPVKVDVRVIAATHRDLRNEIESGRFREDLYFRLGQLRIVIPALRERLDDIPVLCRKLLATIAADRAVLIEQSALAHLGEQPWPGNVRELRNVLTRAAALCTDDVIKRSDVAGEGFGFRGTREERSALDLSGLFSDAKERAIHRFEAAYLSALMKRCGGNVSLAARESGVARHHLRDLLKKRGLYGSSFSEEGE